MIAVAPAVDGSLNQATLAAQTRVQLRKCPANGVALGFVMQSVALVLVLVAASTGVNAVLRFEILSKFIDVDRLNITADGILHLHPVAAVLKGDPLHAILILPYYQRRSCRNGTRGSIGIDI